MSRRDAVQLPALAAGCVLILAVTGCPPTGGEAGWMLAKSLYSMGCTGCEPREGDKMTVMLPGEVPLDLVWLPAGSFQMGRYPGEDPSHRRESPQHRVELSSGFWLGKHEVTKRQWQALMDTTPWSGKPNVLAYPESPAVYISWGEARAYTEALRSYTGKSFRLPSEAEWEYACRAGAGSRFYWGDDPDETAIDAYAWWIGNADDAGEDYAHFTGLKLPNAFGLFDMSGNAREWCEDDAHDDYSGAPADGSAWVDAPRRDKRIIRSSGWNEYAPTCRSADRGFASPNWKTDAAGFRLAL